MKSSKSAFPTAGLPSLIPRKMAWGKGSLGLFPKTPDRRLPNPPAITLPLPAAVWFPSYPTHTPVFPPSDASGTWLRYLAAGEKWGAPLALPGHVAEHACKAWRERGPRNMGAVQTGGISTRGEEEEEHGNGVVRTPQPTSRTTPEMGKFPAFPFPFQLKLPSSSSSSSVHFLVRPFTALHRSSLPKMAKWGKNSR